MDNIEKAKKMQQELEAKSKALAEYIEAQTKADELAAKLFDSSNIVADRSTAAITNVQVEDSSSQTVDAIVEQRETLREKIVRGTKRHLEQRGSLHTRQLVDLLENDGVHITAKNKIVAVSQALGLSGDFDTSRKTGWSLKGESDNAGTLSLSDD